MFTSNQMVWRVIEAAKEGLDAAAWLGLKLVLFQKLNFHAIRFNKIYFTLKRLNFHVFIMLASYSLISFIYSNRYRETLNSAPRGSGTHNCMRATRARPMRGLQGRGEILFPEPTIISSSTSIMPSSALSSHPS